MEYFCETRYFKRETNRFSLWKSVGDGIKGKSLTNSCELLRVVSKLLWVVGRLLWDVTTLLRIVLRLVRVVRELLGIVLRQPQVVAELLLIINELFKSCWEHLWVKGCLLISPVGELQLLWFHTRALISFFSL